MDTAALAVSPSVCNSAGKTWHHCDDSIVSILYVLLTAHPNIMIVFFYTNLMQKLFILIHLLHSSTCFEHYYAHLQEDKLY